jgi:threonine/homoserine/homoserine lactone efflux protein
MGEHRQWWLTVIMVAGIFCGSMLWWIVLSTIVNRFRHRFNDRNLRWMNRIAGLAIGGFGIAAFILNRTRPYRNYGSVFQATLGRRQEPARLRRD